MSDVIDSLLIDIQTQANNVDERLEYISIALGELADAVNRIDSSRMSALSNGLAQVTQSVKGLASTSNKTIASFSDKISKLANINTEGLNRVSDTFFMMGASLSGMGDVQQNVANVSSLASAIAKLGGVKVTQAVENIPALSASLHRMMQVFANAPYVSENTIRMVQAFSELASQGQKVSSATKAINANLKETAKQSEKTKGSIWGLIGKFNELIRLANSMKAIFNRVKSAIDGIWKNADLSMDYVEIYNYWNVVTDKITKEANQKGEEAGGEYVDGFTDQLKTLTKKMTGYALGSAGELVQTDSIGLGMDASAIMQYQAKIMGITNAVGLLEKTSVKTSKALSMLAGDISSLTNQDISTVMQNLQSGLIGQSRALYKYGIDITNNTLAQYALANGISKSVSEMSQSEKMYLRMIAILDQSKVAWGDQANTINSVANQYRIMKQQLANLSRTIGNLFLPIIQKVLPYINGFIIALQRLLSLLGFKIYGGNWLKDLQDGISGGASALDGMDDGAENLGDALDEAGKSAKKLKSNLLGIDELNVLNQEDNSGSGSFKGADISAGLADALDSAIKDYESVWNKAFDNMFNKAEEIADKIMAWFDKISKSQFWQNVKDLAKLLKQIAGYAFTGLKDFWNDFLKPVASWVGNKVLKELLDILKNFVKAIKWDKLRSAFKSLWQVLAKFTIGIGQGLISFLAHVADMALQAIALGINGIAYALEFLANGLNKIPMPVLVAIGGALGGILTIITAYKVAPAIIGALQTAFIKLLYLKDAIVGFFTGLANLNPVVLAIGTVVVAMGALYAEMKYLREEAEKTIGLNIAENLKGTLDISDFAQQAFEGFSKTAEGLQKYAKAGEELSTANSELEDARNRLADMFHLFENGVSLNAQADEIVGAFEKVYKGAHDNFIKAYFYVQMFLQDAIDQASVDELKGRLQNIQDEIESSFEITNQAWEKGEEDINKIVESYNKNTIDLSEAIKQIQDLNKNLHFLDPTTVEEVKLSSDAINKALDFSGLTLDDGSLNVEAFQNKLKDLSTTATTDLQTIKDGFQGQREALEEYLKSAQGLTEETKTTLRGLIDEQETQAIQQYTDSVKTLVDGMQEQLADRLPSIMETATTDWDKMGWLEKLFVFDNDEGAFVANAVGTFQTGFVTPFAGELQGLMEQLGVDGQPWVTDAVSEMFSSVSSYDADLSDWHIEEDFQTKIETMKEPLYASFKESAGYIYSGLDTGIQEAIAGGTVGADLGSKVLEDFNTALDIHSPSGEMLKSGAYTVEGLNKGITENMSSTKEVIFSWAKFIKDTFDSKMPEFRAIGVNIGQGIANGLRSVSGEIQNVVNDIANGIRNSFQISMQIHSPSRVMYRLGEYTMEGLKLGMESLYDSILRSFDRFNSSMIATPSQMSYNVAGAVASGNAKFANQQANSEQTESAIANILIPYLSQIVSNTRETADKDLSVNIGDREIARANNRGQALLGTRLITG